MTEGHYEKAGGRTEGGEITLADVVGFLRRNWKLVALLTLVLSVAAVTILLLLPKSYQKDLVLTTDLSPTSELLAEVDRTILPTRDQISAQAAASLRSRSFGEVQIEPAYNNQTKLLQVTMQSSEENALAGVGDEMVSFLKDDLASNYSNSIDDALELQITQLRGEEEEMRGVLDRVEQMSRDDSSVAEEAALVQFAVAQVDLESMEQSREDLPRLTSKAFSVAVSGESGVVQDRVSTALFLLAVAGSLATALALALLREALARRK